MDFFDAVFGRRSVRSFKQDPVARETLEDLINAARVSPCGANKQPLVYVAVTDEAVRAQIFDCLKWAMHIAPRGTPAEGFTPMAYIIVCVNKDVAMPNIVPYDVGAATQTILLGAVARGLSSCWLKSVNYPKVKQILEVPESHDVDSVIALGAPAEFPKQVDMEPDATDTNYWRDDDDQHFVPKRAMESITHWDKY